jgi:hypothetical protein
VNLKYKNEQLSFSKMYHRKNCKIRFDFLSTKLIGLSDIFSDLKFQFFAWLKFEKSVALWFIPWIILPQTFQNNILINLRYFLQLVSLSVTNKNIKNKEIKKQRHDYHHNNIEDNDPQSINIKTQHSAWRTLYYNN